MVKILPGTKKCIICMWDQWTSLHHIGLKIIRVELSFKNTNTRVHYSIIWLCPLHIFKQQMSIQNLYNWIYQEGLQMHGNRSVAIVITTWGRRVISPSWQPKSPLNFPQNLMLSGDHFFSRSPQYKSPTIILYC